LAGVLGLTGEVRLGRLDARLDAGCGARLVHENWNVA
jgi:hypothetical protein